MGRAPLQRPGCPRPAPRAQRVPAEQGQAGSPGGPQAIFPGTFLPLGGEASGLKQANNKKMTPKLSPQALQFGKSDGAGSPIYLKKQVPSGPAWKTPKVIQSGEWGSYRDQNHHFEGPGFMEVTAQRMGAAAGSQVWTTGQASGRGASGRGPAEPAGGGLPPAQGPAASQQIHGLQAPVPRATPAQSPPRAPLLLPTGLPRPQAPSEGVTSVAACPSTRHTLVVHAARVDHVSPVNVCVHAAGADHASRGDACVHAAGVDHASPGNQVYQEVKARPEAEGP